MCKYEVTHLQLPGQNHIAHVYRAWIEPICLEMLKKLQIYSEIQCVSSYKSTFKISASVKPK